jgi:ferredoxin
MMSLRVSADSDLCCGSGRCIIFAPEVFDCDDDGTVVVVQPEPDVSLRTAVGYAVDGCPTGAIRLDPL